MGQWGNCGDTSLAMDGSNQRMAAGDGLAVPGTGFRDALKVVIGQE